MSHRDSETRGELEREMREHLNKQSRPVWKEAESSGKVECPGVSLALLSTAEQPFTHRPQLSCSASFGEKGIKVQKGLQVNHQ